MVDVIEALIEPETRDELGSGGVRNALSDKLFSGTSTFQTRNVNEMEKEMVEAARTNFEENLAKPAVPALTKAKWLERVAFPLGMNEEGDLFYGSSPEGPN
jgi:hypothetical protein